MYQTPYAIERKTAWRALQPLAEGPDILPSSAETRHSRQKQNR